MNILFTADPKLRKVVCLSDFLITGRDGWFSFCDTVAVFTFIRIAIFESHVSSGIQVLVRCHPWQFLLLFGSLALIRSKKQHTPNCTTIRGQVNWH